MLISVLKRALLILLLFAAVGVAKAERLKPMMLAYSKAGTELSAEAEVVRGKLASAGFRALGEYPVSDSARVLVFSSDELLAAAASAPRAGYIAPLRVSITRVGREIQVSYINLEYFRRAYHIDVSLAPVMARLAQVLGAREAFGAQGLEPEMLVRYRYAFGMERFGDPYLLASHPSRTRALAVLDVNLRDGKGGVREIYRIDIPGMDATLIGVSIREEAGAERDASDTHNVNMVDGNALRHTAYLPYEILVLGGSVEALHMRFRMALHFPDLGMIGEHSFMQLRRSPSAVERALAQVAGRS